MGLAGEASAIYDYLSAATTTTINIAAVAVAINNRKNVKDSCEEKDTKATATIKCNQRVALIAQFDFDLGLTH